MNQNPYVSRARVCTIDNFVFGYIELNTDYKGPENPVFWNAGILPKTKIKRTAGFEDGMTRSILYSAESRDQARVISDLFVEGRGYTIGEHSVLFEPVYDPIPEDLEGAAENAITCYLNIVRKELSN